MLVGLFVCLAIFIFFKVRALHTQNKTSIIDWLNLFNCHQPEVFKGDKNANQRLIFISFGNIFPHFATILINLWSGIFGPLGIRTTDYLYPVHVGFFHVFAQSSYTNFEGYGWIKSMLSISEIYCLPHIQRIQKYRNLLLSI